MARFGFPREHTLEADFGRNCDSFISKTQGQSRLRSWADQHKATKIKLNPNNGLLQSNGLLTSQLTAVMHFPELALHNSKLTSINADCIDSYDNQSAIYDELKPFNESGVRRKIYGYVYGFAAWFFMCGWQYVLIIRRDWGWGWRISISLWLFGLGVVFAIHSADLLFKDGESVTQKYLLTRPNYCNTLIAVRRTPMANALSFDRQVAIVNALAEGSSIRAIERMTGVHRDTIMRLGVRVGQGCQSLLDQKMRGLSTTHLEFDEIWGFIGKKEKHVRPEDNPTLGDVWTFCAIDADTKLVPAFKVGKRDSETANAFVSDVAGRLKNRVQISSDALHAYVGAVEQAFGADVDFAQIVKTYAYDVSEERNYSAPEIVITEKRAVTGRPNMSRASTSYIERLNGTTRLHMRRLTRLTYAFSKKRENFEAAVGLHFAYYNFVKRHITLRCTPAMAAGVERDFWTVADLVGAAA